MQILRAYSVHAVAFTFCTFYFSFSVMIKPVYLSSLLTFFEFACDVQIHGPTDIYFMKGIDTLSSSLSLNKLTFISSSPLKSRTLEMERKRSFYSYI